MKKVKIAEGSAVSSVSGRVCFITPSGKEERLAGLGSQTLNIQIQI